MAEDLRAVRLRVFGVVQGVGFRPFVSRLAVSLGLVGSVANRGPYVEILAQGPASSLAALGRGLREQAPERAAVLRVEESPVEPLDAASFEIVESGREAGAVFVSPDIAICPRCRAELFDPADRRYLHPFINCTACGPRLTILDAMPYDRERTSMKAFPMCEACASEYHDPDSRRYDAQPVCCHDCGPRVRVLDGPEEGAAAITRARQVLAAGGIVAVKGIGGFHLACDAASEAAVMTLRQRKHRPAKPFAVMVRDMAAAAREVLVSPAAAAVLDGPQKPILLLPRRAGGRVAGAAAPISPKLGIMLPYTPLHLLLFDYPDGVTVPDCLVMTSGNPQGAPICRTDDEARQALAGIADLILTHDRRIRVRADDTVMDFIDDAPCMVRRSRGYAPLPVMVSAPLHGAVLAVGGELKNTFCLARDGLFYPSAYVGDLGDPRTAAALRETMTRMESLLEIAPEVVACDLHPRYQSRKIAAELGRPLFPVQHHYAHVLSCLAENDFPGPAIGVAFDGTGYGPDGTIWGGEFLLADAKGFRRLGSIEPFPWAGGDRAAREGWRPAANLLFQVFGDREAVRHGLALELADEKSLAAQGWMAAQGVNCVETTSAGRLFDAVSAVLGLCRSISFEGEAAIRLQAAAEKAGPAGEKAPFAGPLARGPKGRFLLPTGALFREIVARRLRGEAAESLARDFHIGLAAQIVAGCEAIRGDTGLSAAALTGGVFQNELLLRLTEAGLRDRGFQVLRHRLIPPNDGGLALGQALAAMASLSGS